jgi:hypothetical protein
MNVHVASTADWRVLLDQHECVLQQLQEAVADDAWSGASWREAVLDYHKARGRVSVVSSEPEKVARLRRLTDDNVSLERAWRELSTRTSGAAAATVEAFTLGLRWGIGALPGCTDQLRRLSQLSAEQLKDVCRRVRTFDPEIATPWSAKDVEYLVGLWRKRHA